MNKKNIVMGITCGFLLIAGVCYSITFSGCSSSKSLSSSLGSETAKEQDSVNQHPEISGEATPKEALVTAIAENPAKVSEAAKIYVHICGAVMNPGVYQVESGARICDLIEISGGLKKDAAGDYINQAQPVTDGEQVYIPKKDEVKELTPEEYVKGNQKTSEKVGEEASALVNINTAGAEELMTLPGIGQAKADSIIEYRKTNGQFKTIDELMNIPGIKEGVFNRIASSITTG